MKKKEILDSCLPDTIEYPHYNLNDFQQSVALNAMDIYAKIQAIAFDKWKRDLGLIKEKNSNCWLINFSMNEWSKFGDNDESLYDLFLESQIKQPNDRINHPGSH